MTKSKICYLYAEIMGYTLATVNILNAMSVDLCIIHWGDNKKITNFNPDLKSVEKVYCSDDLSFIEIINHIKSFKPDLIVVSGWMDLSYLPACVYARIVGIKVVVCIDDQWHNTFRQKLAKCLAFFHIFKIFYSHAWISGPPQLAYSQNIGFKFTDIIYDLYSCDTAKFVKIDSSDISLRKNFIYVGRFESEKGLNLLVDAWKIFRQKFPDWTLTLIGSGLHYDFTNIEGLNLKSFLSSNEIIVEARKSTCFILPSIFEPWGVVVHEFASMGLPIIVSDCVGSRSDFVINKFNGFIFKTGNANCLLDKMIRIANLSQEDLSIMADNSHYLSSRITPVTSANNLISLINP